MIDGNIIKDYVGIDPLRYEFNNSLAIYEDPVWNCVYAMGVDSSTGVGEDFCAIQILKILNKDLYEQVAVYKNNKIKPIEFANVVNKLSIRYNNALMIVENNDCGKFVTEELWYNLGNGNILNTDKRGIGTRATTSTKLEACMNLRKIAESRKLILHDSETIYQLSRFEQRVENVFKGAKGTHDDLVSALYWATYCIIQPQFDIDAVAATATMDSTGIPDDYTPPPVLFDESEDKTEFWKSFN